MVQGSVLESVFTAKMQNQTNYRKPPQNVPMSHQ